MKGEILGLIDYQPKHLNDINVESVIGQIKPTILSSPLATRLMAGGGEPKAVIEANVAGRSVSLVMRAYDENIVQCWQAFKEARLPVVPTLRRVTIEDSPWVLATDVKADGSEVYGSGLEVLLITGLRRERPPHPSVDQHFLELTNDQNFPKIIVKADSFSRLASAKGLLLPEDDAFELLVRPDGSWNLIILDLSGGRVIREDLMRKKPDFCVKDNAKFTKDFFDHIINLREILGSQSKK